MIVENEHDVSVEEMVSVVLTDLGSKAEEHLKSHLLDLRV